MSKCQKLRISATVELNEKLLDALWQHLINAANGMSDDDRKEYEEAAISVRSERLNKTARLELAAFLLYRAGFDLVIGCTEAEQWTDQR